MKAFSYQGLLVVDKPPGLTSHPCVDRALHGFRAAHASATPGTLDPLATGVLVLCVGMATPVRSGDGQNLPAGVRHTQATRTTRRGTSRQ